MLLCTVCTGYKVGWSLLLISLVLMIIISIVLTFKLWMPLRRPVTSSVSMLQNSNIVLTEVNSLFYRKVIINWETEDDANFTAIHKSDAVINFYHVESSCDHMSLLETDVVVGHSLTVFLTDENISSYTPVYALKESSFDYKIDSQVQFVKVCVYIGTNYDKGTRLSCTRVLLSDGSGHFHVNKSGYYFFKVETPGASVQYLLSVTENLKTLNLNTEMLFDCEINATNDLCPLALQKNREVCVIAQFYRTVNDVSEVKLKVQFEDGNVGLLLIFPLSIVAFVFFVISVLLLVLIFCCCVRIRKLYRHATVV